MVRGKRGRVVMCRLPFLNVICAGKVQELSRGTRAFDRLNSSIIMFVGSPTVASALRISSPGLLISRSWHDWLGEEPPRTPASCTDRSDGLLVRIRCRLLCSWPVPKVQPVPSREVRRPKYLHRRGRGRSVYVSWAELPPVSYLSPFPRAHFLCGALTN